MPLPSDRMPVLAIEGAALVLRDAYTATVPVRMGDTLKITGEWRVAPTEGPTDECIGLAANSATIGQPVGIVLAGLAQVITTTALQRGDSLTAAVAPGGHANRGKSQSVAASASPEARKHAVAAESQPTGGKPVWVHLRPMGR